MLASVLITLSFLFYSLLACMNTPRAQSVPLLGNFACFCCCRLLIFLLFYFCKINFSEKLFQDYNQIVKQFGPRSGPTFCRA